MSPPLILIMIKSEFADVQNLFSCVHSDYLPGKFGGVMAIKELIDCPSAGAETKAIKFANTLSFAIRLNTDFYLLEIAAEALGYMAKFSPVSHVDP